MGLKAVFFDLDDTLYTSFQAGDAYAYEKLEEWAISTFGDKGKGFADAFRVNRKRLARQQPAMPPTHDRVLFAQGALERTLCKQHTVMRRRHGRLLPCQTLAVDAECVRKPLAFVSKRADGPLLQLFVGVGVPGLKAGV